MATELTPAEVQSFEAFAALEAVLAVYVDAIHTGNGDAMRSTFYDHAHVVGALDGDPIDLDADAFAAFISTPGGSPRLKSHIASTDIQGNAASARLEFFDWGGVRYTHFIILYTQGGEWRISGVVYDSHSRN